MNNWIFPSKQAFEARRPYPSVEVGQAAKLQVGLWGVGGAALRMFTLGGMGRSLTYKPIFYIPYIVAAMAAGWKMREWQDQQLSELEKYRDLLTKRRAERLAREASH